MKRRIVATLLAMSLLVAMAPATAIGEEELELSFSANELVQNKTENTDGSVLDNVTNQNAAIMEALGQKDWNALAEAVKLTGDWRDDLVNVAESQVGYAETSDGMTIYTTWAEEEEAVEWTALFVSWVAEKAGLSSREFPRGNSYDKLRSAMNKVKAVKKITRNAYPTAGDLAFIEHEGQKLVGIVTYVSNGYASMILGDMNGRVVKEIWPVSANGFTYYGDLNVLMERAGIEVGKGGEVPYIPEGGVAAWTNTNAVYMRSEPTTASKRVTTVKKSGTALVVYSGEMQDDGYIWYAVEYGRYEGYIRGDLLSLDMAAIQAAKPVQTPIPAPKPEETVVPGCAVCANAAMGLALPEVCCYEQLAALGAHNARLLMDALKRDDKETYELYARCHEAHVAAGAPAIPFDSGLIAQERVVNIEVVQAEAGQNINITFEIYGAVSYEWHQIRTTEKGSWDTVLKGAETDTLTVAAKTDANYGYYCIATISANGTKVEIVGKTTALTVNSAPIVADAIIGEEVNFTYSKADAAGYQWYVCLPGAAEFSEAKDENGVVLSSSKITLAAELAMSGAVYYAEALASDGSVLGTSQQFSYVISTEFDKVLDKYVDELAHMTLDERYTALSTTWNIAVSETDATTISQKVISYWEKQMKTLYPYLLCVCDEMAVPGASHGSSCPWYVYESEVEEDSSGFTVYYDCSSFPEECAITTNWLTRNAGPMEIYGYLSTLEYNDYLNLLLHAGAAHPQIAEELLCTCAFTDEEGNYLLVAPGSGHLCDEESQCPWYIASLNAEALTERMEAEPGFAEWAATASEEMIARALTVESLDHLVVDNGMLYIAREENPRATVDENGYITDLSSGFVIARIVDGVFYPIAEDPAPVQ